MDSHILRRNGKFGIENVSMEKESINYFGYLKIICEVKIKLKE